MEAPLSALAKYLIDGHSGQKFRILYPNINQINDLSRVTKDFNEGRKTSINEIMVHRDSERYFRDKGKDFCAGYLSKFGEIVRKNGCDIWDDIKWGALKIIESSAYKTAKKVWKESQK